MYKLIFLFAVFAFKGSHGDASLGKCTDIEPITGFNMNRFLGYWYAIQTTRKPSPCLSYYIAQDPQHESQYKITEIEQHTTVWASALYHEHNVTGELTVPDKNKPGRMNLDLPLDIGTTTFTVFMTDYDNYAAIFTCKKYPLMHIWSATILSRTHTLDMAFVDKVRTRLASYNIDPFNLEIVSQKLCPKPGTKGSLIKTASNVVTGVRDKISDVVDSVEGTVKSLISDPSIKNTEEQPDNVPRTFGVRQDGAQNVGETISNAANNFGEKVSGMVGNFGDQTVGAFNNVKDGASKVVNNVGEKVSEVVDDLGDRTAGAINNVKDGASKVVKKFSDVVDDFEDRAAGVVHNVRDGASKSVDNAQENVDAIARKFADVVKDAGKKIDSIN